MAEGKDDEEINIDFSKITNFFKEKKKRLEKSEDNNIISQSETKEEGSVVKDAEDAAEKKAIKSEEEENKEKTKETEKKTEVKEDDEEITIDFSKITRFFKKEKNSEKKKDSAPIEERTESVKKVSEDDDEISFDFSRIKDLFKRSKEEQSSDEEDISIDWKKVSAFFSRNKVIFLLLIPLFLSIFLRIQPAYLPMADQWAEESVMNSIRNQVSSQIDQQAPHLPANYKEIQIQSELDKILKSQGSQIKQQIEATADYFRSRLQDKDGQTYLLAIDPWFWMRHARNVIENGHPGDEIKDGKPWNNHMFAPSGRRVPPDMFHAYFEAYLYKFFSIFNKNLSLMGLVFYIPVLLSALAVIPAFFLCRRLGGDIGAFIGASIVAIHPSFLSRTAGGFADTDAYNILFPLMIAWLFLEAIEAKSFKKGIIFSGLSGVFVGLFAFSWGGWWFIFDFILASTALYFIYYVLVHRKDLKNILNNFEIKNSLISLLSFVTFSGIFVTIFKGFNAMINEPFLAPIGFAKLKEVGIRSVWPNVYTTVAELNPAALNNVINSIGLGKWIFLLISLIGIVLTLTKLKEKKTWFISGTIAWYLIVFWWRPQDLNLFLLLISIPIIIRLIIAIKDSEKGIYIRYALILIIWMTSTIYASVKGIRFMILLVPPFAIGMGIALGQFYDYSKNWLTKSLNINKTISKTLILIFLIIFFLGIPFLESGGSYYTAIREIPSMNDAWFASLEKINEQAAPDAIINSWWDFGHWFKYIGDRAVTFDGTSQNTHQAHWIGNSLLTSNENISMGILRMLDCSGYSGGTYAYRKILKIIEDQPKSVDLIYKIIQVDKNKAGEILKENGFGEQDIDEVLRYSHCDPPENYFITSDDMIGKSGVWAHFGSWNFDRALIYNKLKSAEYKGKIEPSIEFLQQRFNYSREQAEEIYYEVLSITNNKQANDWIAPWPGYVDTTWHGCSLQENNKTLKCNYFVGIGSSNGQRLVLESASINPDNISETNATIGYYDQRTGKKLGISQAKPNSVAILKEDSNFEVSKIPKGNLGLDLTLDLTKTRPVSMVTHPAITGSMFQRLYFLDGIGLKYFDKFNEEKSFTGNRIVIWKVDWEGKNINTPPKKTLAQENQSNNKEQISEDINTTDDNKSL